MKDHLEYRSVVEARDSGLAIDRAARREPSTAAPNAFGVRRFTPQKLTYTMQRIKIGVAGKISCVYD